MRIAVLTLTRDRIESSAHCFASLRKHAGCDYDHFVLDQASEDGTQDWLETQNCSSILSPHNVGISRGINLLLSTFAIPEHYDVVVKYDNDCELTVPDTLRVAAEIANGGEWIMSPHIMGLNSPPAVGAVVRVGSYRVGIPSMLGGIFMAAPASLYETYRHDENNPPWGMDDVNLWGYWRGQGKELGYLLDYPANHYLSTQGQWDRWPEYFARKTAEGSP